MAATQNDITCSLRKRIYSGIQWKAFRITGLVLLVILSACKPEKVPDPFRPSDRHDAYIHSLRLAGLGGTALARDWIKASENVLLQPVEIETPYEEVFYADPKEAFAAAFRFSAKKGQKIIVEITHQGLQPGRLFMDLFRVREGGFQNWQKAASSPYQDMRLEFEPRRDYDYVFRFQPELLRGGTYRIIIQRDASLLFPVPDMDSRAIQSGFGAPRDGGKREHHGVDIFAPRHTPVIAPLRAVVRRVSETDIGGRTVWLYDSKRSMHLYFAHLQTQDVEESAIIEAGQKIGTIGNTGNAQTTPPHLHFGIYIRGEGPVDPYHFISHIHARPSPILADKTSVGRWVRLKSPSRLSPALGTGTRDAPELPAACPLLVLAASGRSFRVRLPDGRNGYIPSNSVEAVESPLRNLRPGVPGLLLASPRTGAAEKIAVESGEELGLLATFEGYGLVKTEEGLTGWIPLSSALKTDGSPSR